MKRKLSILELKLAKVPIRNKASSQNTFLESLKKKTNVSSIKKMSWKIVKIITKEGEYIPSADNEVFLVMTKKSKVRSKIKSKK